MIDSSALAVDIQPPAGMTHISIRVTLGVLVQGTMKGVQVPSSVPQLTTKQVLTMSFVEGQPITRLRVSCAHPFHSICCASHVVHLCSVYRFVDRLWMIWCSSTRTRSAAS